MEYKRLTDRTKAELLEDCHNCPYCGVEFLYDCHQKVGERLAELEDKIENGTLIELPCKLGDTVYCLCKGNYVLVGEKTGWTYDIKEFKFTLSVFGTWKYGETLFLTREEAEKKLEELKSEM